MATDFTNKYMQVFQDYNEFGEHSADYVRGEDHIAFLIEENEVIYWLYLEQVWRPLNVRTTTTGELEDGRTKVAVRLEYIEGGQKYTSVPNIPDPERITSMSRFLEDYPDIEEVNVSGTVNLTDLSYAFAGSKIKDFSMLDTSNVDNISYMLENLDNENLDIIINTNVSSLNYNNIIRNTKINSLTINAINNKTLNLLAYDGHSYIKNIICTFNDDIIDNITDYRLNFDESIFSIIENINYPFVHINCGNHQLNNEVKIKTKECTVVWDRDNTFKNIYNIDANKITIYVDANLYANFKLYLTDSITEINITNKYNGGFNFGYGISKNPNTIFKFNNNIGGLLNYFDVVDEINNDYINSLDNPGVVCLCQYKTLFEEAANININENPINYDLRLNTDNDCNPIDIIIKNKIDIYDGITNFNKLIIDNSYFNYNKNNCPIINSMSAHVADYKENSYIKGCYKLNNNAYNNVFFLNKIYIDFTLYSNEPNNHPAIYIEDNIINTNNIKIEYEDYLDVDISNINISDYIQINNIFDGDIHISIRDNIYNYKRNNKRIEYIDNKKLYIHGLDDVPCITPFINYCMKENTIYFETNNIISFQASFPAYDSSKYCMFDNNYDLDFYNNCPDLYLYCSDNTFIKDFIVTLRYIYDTASKRGHYIKTKHIYGKINFVLDSNFEEDDMEISYIHIDINKVMCAYTDNAIKYYTNLDEETTINLITKLIDNTDSSSKTIYMYRSQANIIGEENIAGAVAKNYEFAIIEN